MANRHNPPHIEDTQLHREIKQVTAIVGDLRHENDLLRHDLMGGTGSTEI
jgi:hypothetical protein